MLQNGLKWPQKRPLTQPLVVEREAYGSPGMVPYADLFPI